MFHSIRSRLIPNILASSLAVWVVACGGGSGPETSSSSNMALQGGPDGTPTGDGTSCSWPVPPSAPGVARSATAAGGSTGSGCVASSDGTTSCPAASPTPAPQPAPIETSPPPVPPVKEYSLGDWFPSPDGCHTCTCTERGIMCTVNVCAPPGPPTVLPPAPPPSTGCTLDGHTIAPGTSVRSSDGCHTCGCTTEGLLACTDEACLSGKP
jgi:hypothetical protein